MIGDYFAQPSVRNAKWDYPVVYERGNHNGCSVTKPCFMVAECSDGIVYSSATCADPSLSVQGGVFLSLEYDNREIVSVEVRPSSSSSGFREIVLPEWDLVAGVYRMKSFKKCVRLNVGKIPFQPVALLPVGNGRFGAIAILQRSDFEPVRVKELAKMVFAPKGLD